jgi:hypothetical protein
MPSLHHVQVNASKHPDLLLPVPNLDSPALLPTHSPHRCPAVAARVRSLQVSPRPPLPCGSQRPGGASPAATALLVMTTLPPRVTSRCVKGCCGPRLQGKGGGQREQGGTTAGLGQMQS